MKKRWKLLIGLGVAGLVGILAPIAYIETGCRTPVDGFDPRAPYKAILPPAEHRGEARTWLTFPEWHIVYSAESYGRHLMAGRRPSAYPFFRDIGDFWSGYCQLNRVTAGSDAAGEAKVMIYTIGISYSVEMAVKAVYERTFGRFTEWASGWTSADDRYAAHVQRRYGAFMHETPWYRFPFGKAFSNEWRTSEPRLHFRHWERRFALSAEYGVKAGYAKLIGAASGATLGRDELTLRFIVRGTPAGMAAIDPRLKPVRTLPGGLTVVEAPRYAQFSTLLDKMAQRRVRLVEVAGNDDIFLTALVPDAVTLESQGKVLMSTPLADRVGWKRVGLSLKVPALLETMRSVTARGGAIEHVYDY